MGFVFQQGEGFTFFVPLRADWVCAQRTLTQLVRGLSP